MNAQAFAIPALYEGTELNLTAEIKVVCPALSLGQLKVLQPHIAAIRSSEEATAIDTIDLHGIPVIGAALRRNYPNATDDDIREAVDARTFKLFLAAALGAEKGEAKAVQV